MLESKSTRIAIVGAGVSGLTTAWYLQRLLPDAQVDVFEASDKVGGVIQTHICPPFLAELGADNFATLVPDALRMVEEMGIRDQFISPKADHRIAQVVRNGQVIPIPNGFSLMQPTRLSSVPHHARSLLRGPIALDLGILRQTTMPKRGRKR